MARKKISTKEIKEVLKDEKVKKIEVKETISTGSTLLDLIISGGRKRDGGIPGGIVVEISGPPASGKTSILTETAGNAQRKGGEVRFDDPEGRLDEEYSKIYGFNLEKKNYNRPDTVNEMFNGLWNWEPKNDKVINVSCEDSLAALSTEMEMDDEDKMGMKRAKDFSAGFRKTCRLIANNNWLILCSNQEREGSSGITTPGGKGIPYYSSLRIRISPLFQKAKIIKTKTFGTKKVEKVLGIRSKCQIKKSSIDDSFRECCISIIFGYGIHDIRENLIFIKEHTGAKKFSVNGEEFAFVDRAIQYVEDNDLEEELKNDTIDLWHEIESSFKTNKTKKKRR